MTEPVRERILAAIAARLAAIATIDGLAVERNRDEPVERFPSLIVIDGPQVPNDGNSGVTFYEMTVDIEGHVRAGTAAEVGAALTRLYAAAWRAIAAEVGLGGLATDIAEGPLSLDDRRGSGGTPQGAFNLEITVTYQTAAGDPFALGTG